MNKKNQYEKRLVKTVGDKEKINMAPIVENITKLVGAVVIVIMFLLFFSVFAKGTWFHAMQKNGYAIAGEYFFNMAREGVTEGKRLLDENFIGLGRHDAWIAITIWTFFFGVFLTALISYIVFYIKDLIALIEAIVKTTGRIGHSITDTLKESDLWKEDILGRSKREKANKKQYYYEDEDEEDNDEYEERLIPRKQVKKKTNDTPEDKSIDETRKPRRILYDDVDDSDEEEIEELMQKFEEVKEREKTEETPEKKEEVVKEIKEEKDEYSDLSDEDLDSLLKGE